MGDKRHDLQQEFEAEWSNAQPVEVDRSGASKSTVRTKSGRSVTEAEVEALADEAERGYDVEHLAKQPGRPRLGSAPAVVVPIRMPPDLKADVERRAEAESTSVSEIVRAALRAYLNA